MTNILMRRLTHVLTAAMGLGVAGCGRHDAGAAKPVDPPPMAVSVERVSESDWAAYVDVPGTVRAAMTATLSSRVMGYVQEVRVRAGDSVQAGQTVVSVDARDLDAGLAGAKAAEQEAREGIAEADQALVAANTQRALAQVTFDRMKTLFEKKSLSNQEFDEAQARLRTAEASVRMAEARRQQLNARIAQAREAVSAASILSGYAEIRAPFAGLVTSRLAEPGTLAAPGTPLLVIERAGEYRLEAPVEESQLRFLRLGQTVPLIFEGQEAPLSGRVVEISPAVDPASRAATVKAAIDRPAGIRSGLFGRLRIAQESRRTIVIPAGATARRGSLVNVLTVNEGRARLRVITTGEQRDGRVEVLSGLDAGDTVVHPRPAELADGLRVEVRR